MRQDEHSDESDPAQHLTVSASEPSPACKDLEGGGHQNDEEGAGKQTLAYRKVRQWAAARVWRRATGVTGRHLWSET